MKTTKKTKDIFKEYQNPKKERKKRQPWKQLSIELEVRNMKYTLYELLYITPLNELHFDISGTSYIKNVAGF